VFNKAVKHVFRLVRHALILVEKEARDVFMFVNKALKDVLKEEDKLFSEVLNKETIVLSELLKLADMFENEVLTFMKERFRLFTSCVKDTLIVEEILLIDELIEELTFNKEVLKF
jgi:hypothetical protein